MAGTFRLKGMLIPSQGRKSSQGGGMIGGGVVSSIGTPAESAATVINNINNVTNVVAGDYSKITRITITDLLALDPSEVGDRDLFIVYASGSDADGWSGDDFAYDGNTYPAESFFQLINGEWTPITDEIDLIKTLKFDDLPDTVYMIESLFPQTSFPNIYGREKAGMRLARIGKYQVDEKGNYKPVFETTGAPGGGTSSNWLWTITVPFARSYMQGGERVYEGGVLSSADYQQFKELTISGGANIYFAEYGVTSHAEMKAAYNAGKFVILRRDTELFVLMSAATSTSQYVKEKYSFAKTRDHQIYIISVDNKDTWTSSLVSLITSSDIRENADGWSGASDAEVPSALLVNSTFNRLSSVAWTGDYDDLLNKPSSATDAVRYSAQSLTDAQKTQARNNIGAGGVLTFDTTPTANSTNPVTSDGIKTALDGKSPTDHTHSGYASTSTVQEIVTAMNNFATKSLDNLASGAGTNVTTALSKTNVGAMLDKLDVNSATSFTPSATTYFVMSYGSGASDRVKSTLVINRIISDVEAAMESIYVKKTINNSILLEQMWTITSVSSSSVGWSSANVRTNAKYNLSSTGWFVAIGTGARVSNNSTQYGTVWDGNADNRINMGSGRVYVCLGHRDLSYSQSSANFKKLIKHISSAKWLFFNEKTGKTQDVLDFICPIAYVWENDAETYVNCLLMVTKPMADCGIDSTIANTNSFFHVVIEGLPIENWE